MPSIAEASPSPPLNARKRRRDDGFDLSADTSGVIMEMQIEMKLAASPHMPHYQTTSLSHAEQIIEKARERTHKTPRSRRDAQVHSKKQRTSESWDARDILDDTECGVEYKAKEAEQRVEGKGSVRIDLSPCHICHRKPSERKHLDGYADCESCGRRTCYVCIRQCEGLTVDGKMQGYFASPEFGSDGSYERLTLGWHGDEMCVERARKDGYDADADAEFLDENSWESRRGAKHRGKVCSRCCVERGEEGEVWCLVCLRAEEGD